MMYPSDNITLGNMRLCEDFISQKEVQIANDNIMNNKYNMFTGKIDYESKGRAFESLRVRQSQSVLEVFKKRFVPLIGYCTSFNRPMHFSDVARLYRYGYKLWQAWSRPYAP